ncbi:FAD-dependent oxidoreductase [Streptomyces sp. RB6PN25]|uniref:FAD-dependent oxidoreductase n=1 Tax=Streptomyces humicola TaxID=2953240 RepID=A0ABT1PY27_9ACTN|nr:FAD-dependent oxidoreductase [Streptomyces humicola]MCQ4082013.1 FAD-dependent oxidoreductase [Streptomyces humicola]
MLTKTSASTRHRVTVIGGGVAGARLAYQLRAAGDGCEVTVIGEEAHAPYNRVLLADVLAGRYAPEVVSLPEAPGMRRGVRAVRIDRDERRVVCDDGSLVPYDTLVLATGSNPVLPPLRGLLASGESGLPDGVHAFRTMDDCLALAAATRPGVRAVVVGGGLLGVSAARALAARGAQVVLAQQGEHLMEHHLDAMAAALVRSHLEALGVEVHLECRVRGLTGTARARAVELADGYRLDTDVVVLACGVRPRVGLAHAAGLDVERGVLVDDRLRSSDPRIRAIGDCAEHEGVVYGLAGPAIDQADLLARLLTGGQESAPQLGYAGTRALTRLTLPGPSAHSPLDIATFGTPVPVAGDDVLRLSDATRGVYRKVVLRDDRLIGGILLGDLTTVGALARTWEDDEPIASDSSPLHLLTHDGGSSS